MGTYLYFDEMARSFSSWLPFPQQQELSTQEAALCKAKNRTF
ncbi:hypothetical protein [Mailhella sp.]